MKILKESLFERDEETRFSGRYVPPQYRKIEKKRTGEDGPSKDPYDNRGARTYKGKATQSEFNKVLGKAIENDKDYIPEPHSYTPREFGKHLRPFKEVVTNKGLLTKFDKVKPEEIRKLLLLSLDATELPNDIRVYIEEKIVDANDALTLAKLVLKYTIDMRNPDTVDSGNNIFKEITLSPRHHNNYQLRELDKIRKFK